MRGISTELTPAEALKFELLGDGLAISADAQHYIDERNGHRAMTPADYASTSGIILCLDGNVWVNAPVATYNPNFVVAPTLTLDVDDDGLFVRRGDDIVRTKFWCPPAFHDQVNEQGEPYISYGFTHTDRLRISPVEGCALTCKFCDLPYEFRYRTKRIEGLVDTVRVALADPIQPAHHVLVSGGVPRPADFGYLQECYETVLTRFPGLPVDIMMVPSPGLLDIRRLAELGLAEFSINVEIFNRDIAKSLMRRKYDQGLDYYLDVLGEAAEVLGHGRVRSMLVTGLEPMEDTLAGVRAIAERGCVPVLSPFRPDVSTPLATTSPPTAEFMVEVYLRAKDITTELGVPLGPSCIPCSHNTLTLADDGHGDAHRSFGQPFLV